MTASANADFARALIAHLAANDVRAVVLSPGSRSGPLAHALAEAASPARPPGAPHVDLHVRIDERDAAFTALGLAIARGIAAVVTTSGTAVGNLVPAMMEAHHAGVALVAITADRPFELRATGANQTTRQRGIFTAFARASLDLAPPADGRDGRADAAAAVGRAVAAASGAGGAFGPGPVHMNVQFREPLGAAPGPWPAAEPADFPIAGETDAPPLPADRQGVVVAGDRAGAAAAVVASRLGWPLLAEPSSGARYGPVAIPGYADLLASPAGEALAGEAEMVLVVGRPTLSRAVRSLVERAPILWVARHGGPWREAPLNAALVLPDLPFSWIRGDDAAPDGTWLRRWLAAASRPSVAPDPAPWSFGGAGRWDARAVAEAVAAAAADLPLVVGSSGVVRALDAVMPAPPSPRPRPVVANRGLAGIDGTIATAGGVALGLGEPVVALVGDLTFLHDAGGLLFGARERRPDLRIVVVNDGGGTIFRRLEHSGADPDAFERVFLTPHGADIGGIARGYGADHLAVGSLGELRAALAEPIHDVQVVEARVR